MDSNFLFEKTKQDRTSRIHRNHNIHWNQTSRGKEEKRKEIIGKERKNEGPRGSPLCVRCKLSKRKKTTKELSMKEKRKTRKKKK